VMGRDRMAELPLLRATPAEVTRLSLFLRPRNGRRRRA
jgi:hypothetical protein